MSMVAALLFERFQAGAAPLAVVSMDNCSHNGEKLQSSVMTVAKAWAEKGYVGQDFIAYLEDESKIAFPWSMIDKITPRPHKIVEEQMVKDNIEDMEPIVTSKNTFIAAFVNAERPQYLVVEDKFPNGRPPLEKAGVCHDRPRHRQQTERMKGHLPEPAAHRHERLRLHAGLYPDLRRDEGCRYRCPHQAPGLC